MSVRASKVSAAIVALLVTIAPMLVAPPSGAATSNLVSLASQTPFVSAPTGSRHVPLIIRLSWSPGSLDPATTTAAFSLGARLITRGSLLADIASPPDPSSAISSSAAMPLNCFAGADTSVATIVLTISTQPRAGTGCSPGGKNLSLSCSGDQCAGVYPLTVTINGTSVPQTFCTFVTIVPSGPTTPVRVAVVLPLQSVNRPTQSLGSNGISRYSTMFAELGVNPTVPLTLAAVPATLGALSHSTSPQAVSLLNTVVRFSRNPKLHTVLPAPFVRTDPGSLLAHELPGELKGELRAGSLTLRTLGVHTSGPLTWISTTGDFSPSASGLAAAGAGRAIVPQAGLSPPLNSTLNWAQPFTYTTGLSAGLPAGTVDPDVEAHFDANQSRSALAATQLLADLSFIYFEEPGLSEPRGVIAMPSASWQPAPGFVATLLHGLSHNPILKPVTTNGYFGQVPIGANGAPSLRSATSGTMASLTKQVSLGIANGRLTLRSFATSAGVASPLVGSLNNELLSAGSVDLTAPQANVALSSFTAQLTAAINTVSIVSSPITLTSHSGTIPITLESTSSTPLRGILELSSTKLSFPAGARRIVVLDQSTHTIRVEVTAPTTGDLPLNVRFVSLDGRLVFARAEITVASTKTSLVAIALTTVAIGVLGVWWLRTWRRGRAERDV